MSFRENKDVVLRELDTVMDRIDEREIGSAIAMVQEADKVFFYALGRAGFMGKSFVMRLMHMGKEVYVLGETNTTNFGPEDLLIICSGSGETAQFIDTARKAQRLGGKVLVFTTKPRSTLASLADGIITIPTQDKNAAAGGVASVQPMASLFEQSILLTGDTMVLTMMENATNGAEMFKKHSNLE